MNDLLSAAEAGDARIYGKVEAYSCKTVGEDKRLYKTLESKYIEDMESEVPELSTVSPFGPLTQQASRKTLYHLIATLNASFPDYDFSNVKAEHFTKQSALPLVINSINSSLTNLGENAPDLVQKMWTAIDGEVNLADCDVYCFFPDVDSDPYGDDGSIWSFHYFFYNKKRKRIIFITCKAVSLLSSRDDDESLSDLEDVEMDMDYDERPTKRSTSSGSWVPFDSLMQAPQFGGLQSFRTAD